MAPALVGRADDLARLRALLADAASGHGGSAVVVGEGGLGKTTLIDALVDDATGVTVAAGACSPGAASHLPYAPWIDILTVLDQAASGVTISDNVRRAVAPLLRPWEALDTGVSGSGVLFAGVTEFVARVAADRPVLIVVEDVHWADAASLDLLAHVARRAPRAPLVVAATGRPFDGLAELTRAATTVVSLTPLTDKHIGTIVGDVPDRERVVRLAEGNPFLALHLAHRASVATDNDDVLGVQRALREPEANRLLVRLGLAGDLPDDLVALATAMSLDRRLRLSRALIDDGLLTVRAGRLHFRHALIREEVLALATPAEIADAHGDIADAMAPSIGDDGAAALAHHQLAAGRWADGLRSSLRAADHADRIHAHRAALEALTAARSAWSRAENPSIVAGISVDSLLLRLGRTARSAGDFAAGHAAWNELGSLRHDPATVAYERGLTFYLEGHEGAAVEEFERADSLLDASSTVSRGDVLVALTRASLSSRPPHHAGTIAEIAVMVTADDSTQHLDARISLTVAEWLGDGDDAIADAELRAHGLDAERIGSIALILRAYGNLLGVLLSNCRFASMLIVVDHVAEVSSRYEPFPLSTSIMTPYHVEALRALGRWDEAAAIVERAVEDARFRGNAPLLHVEAALVWVNRGNWDAAAHCIEQAESSWVDDEVVAAMLLHVRCRLALHRGHEDEALALLRAALAAWHADVDPMATWRLYRDGWRMLAEIADPTGLIAHELERLAGGSVRRTVFRVVRGQARAERARALHTADEVVQWATVVESLRVVGWRGELPEALLRHGQALAHARRLTEAGRLAHEARTEAEAIGAGAVREDADRLLALLGHPATRSNAAQPERPMGLTPREVQVLDLLTRGASNREIGRTLFISERTAGVHVSNIIGKLGVANRTQAAQIGTRLADRE